MKVAWFTPLSKGSALAERSVRLGEELAKSCDVEIWAGDEGPWHETSVPVTDYRQAKPDSRLRHFDFLIYNFGDDLRYHGAIYDVARRHPGICVLHDRTYHNLIASHPLGTPHAELIAGAEGVLVHAAGQAETIVGEWLGPVGRIHFPVYGTPRLSAARDPESFERATSEILSFLEIVSAWRPVLALSRRIAEELGHFRASPTAPVVSEVAMELVPLLRS